MGTQRSNCTLISGHSRLWDSLEVNWGREEKNEKFA